MDEVARRIIAELAGTHSPVRTETTVRLVTERFGFSSAVH